MSNQIATPRIKANRGRILVKKLPRHSDYANKLNLVLVDQQKHYVGVRYGEIQSVGKGIYEVKPGDVVLFRADAGFTLDPESGSDIQDSENSFHWLKESDCLAIEEPLELALEVLA
jgi:hypothetical protein